MPYLRCPKCKLLEYVTGVSWLNCKTCNVPMAEERNPPERFGPRDPGLAHRLGGPAPAAPPTVQQSIDRAIAAAPPPDPPPLVPDELPIARPGEPLAEGQPAGAVDLWPADLHLRPAVTSTAGDCPPAGAVRVQAGDPPVVTPIGEATYPPTTSAQALELYLAVSRRHPSRRDVDGLRVRQLARDMLLGNLMGDLVDAVQDVGRARSELYALLRDGLMSCTTENGARPLVKLNRDGTRADEYGRSLLGDHAHQVAITAATRAKLAAVVIDKPAADRRVDRVEAFAQELGPLPPRPITIRRIEVADSNPDRFVDHLVAALANASAPRSGLRDTEPAPRRLTDGELVMLHAGRALRYARRWIAGWGRR